MAQQLFQRACRVTIDRQTSSSATSFGGANFTPAGPATSTPITTQTTTTTTTTTRIFQSVFDPAAQVPGLRVKFKFRRTLRKEPNTAEISIYNINKDHRAAMNARYDQVTLEAGYADGIGLIFSGQARTIDHVREGVDWVTKIQIGDAEVPYRYGRKAQSYAPGVGILQVAKDLIGTLGPMTAGSPAVIAQALTGVFQSGYAVHGPAAGELSRVLRGSGLEWSIQHGKVQVLPIGKANTETAVLLTPQTGLVGSPAWGTPEPSLPRMSNHTLKFKALIQPTLNPGALASIQSASAKGLFRIQSIEGTGDTHGSSDWILDCEGSPTS